MKVEPKILVQTEPFDVRAECDRLTAGRRDIGGLVTFTGLCRDESGTLAALELEHYPGMAVAELRRVALEALERWPLKGVTLIHRTGRILPGEPIVFVAAASEHRRASFEAADFLMDFLKTRAPFWKKEHPADGSSGGWVEAKESDGSDADRWQAADKV